MNQPIAMNTTRKHVVWLDVVRLVAMFTVVCCHSADPFNFYPLILNLERTLFIRHQNGCLTKNCY